MHQRSIPSLSFQGGIYMISGKSIWKFCFSGSIEGLYLAGWPLSLALAVGDYNAWGYHLNIL